ncbi:MAG: hypothetical protein P8N02_01475, partial [Actinomycetota bacterium]|nr:hypothetical protein [Actinomycetota bacterium]
MRVSTRLIPAALALLVFAGSACGSPAETTISQMPDASTGIAADDGSDMGVPDPPSDVTEVGAATTTSVPPLGAEGAFDPVDGRPVRVLVRAEGADTWHWIDAQTGGYVAPGTAPEVLEFDSESLVSTRAEVAPNCEDEGSRLHVTVGHATVQKSGRYIASEAVFQNSDCSGEPFAWRAVAIDRETGLPVVRFRLGDGSTAVTELEYDVTGTWLLITLADGSVEWQGGSGRVELDAQDSSGAVVAVAEASWGTEPPVGEIPGRVFVPNASGEDPSAPYPEEHLDLSHGGEVFSVVLAADTSSDSRAVRNAVGNAVSAGYSTGPTRLGS